MKETNQITITLKVDDNNYKDYERALDNFLNSFNAYGVDVKENKAEVEETKRVFEVKAEKDGVETVELWHVIEKEDVCDLYLTDVTIIDNLFQEHINIDNSEDEIKFIIKMDIEGRNLTLVSITELEKE